MIIVAVIIFALIGLSICLFFGFYPQKPNKKGEYPPRKMEQLVTYIISLLAVFIGAFLAYYLSDIHTRNNEKSYLFDLMTRTTTELGNEVTTIDMLYDYFTSKSDEEAERRMDANSVQDIFSLNILINSDEFSKHVSPSSSMLIQSFTRQKENIRNFMNNPEYPLDNRIHAYQTYSKLIDDIRNLIVLESKFLHREINYKEMLDSYNNFNFVNNDELEGYFDDYQYGQHVPLPKQQ